jgi:uncharacterized protein YbjT (DUF2867 family)
LIGAPRRYVIIGSNIWIDSGPQTLGALANLFQCRFKSSQLFRARIGKDFPDFGCVFAKNRRDQFFAFSGERYDSDAPILGTLDPAYQAPFDEAVNGRTDRAGRKVDLWPDRIHRQRPFVEKHFQYAEVGIVDSRLLKSRIKIFRGSVKGLPPYQPTVDRVSRVLVHDQTIVSFYIADVQRNVSISIELASINTGKGCTLHMEPTNKRFIAVVGATGQQGGAVVRALQAGNQFKVRALTRNPAKHRELADEVIQADLNRPETLKPAFEGAYGVFLVTNFQEHGADELKQARAAVHAAKDAGVKHFVWSTLPDVEAISGGKFHVPHFTGKAKVDRIVKEAGFANHTFVIAPFYYQNLIGVLASQKHADGSLGWALPLDPDVRCIHMGDITEIGSIVAGAFAHPNQVGHGKYLPLVGDFMRFNEIIDALNRQGHNLSFKQVPKEVFATVFPGAAEIAEMFDYFQTHTYLGSDSRDQIALANKIAGRQPTEFSAWARVNFPAPKNAQSAAR